MIPSPEPNPIKVIPLPRELTTSLGFNLIRVAHLKRIRDDVLFRSELGIGLRQFGMLLQLREQEGLGAAQLARRMVITPQSAAPLLADLQRKELVSRRGPARRGSRLGLRITEKGLELLARGAIVHQRTEVEAACSLTASEVAEMKRLLLLIADVYEDVDANSLPKGSADDPR